MGRDSCSQVSTTSASLFANGWGEFKEEGPGLTPSAAQIVRTAQVLCAGYARFCSTVRKAYDNASPAIIAATKMIGECDQS